MIRTLLTRFATGGLGLALLALAATGAVHTAHADGTITPAGDPTTIGPAPDLPDLVVKFEKVSCGPYQEGGVHLLFQARITNMSLTAPAIGTWQTDIRLDGAPVAGSPKLTTGPLFTSVVYSFNVPNMTPGWHVLSAYTDSTLKVAESNDGNNTTMYRIECPALQSTAP